MPSLPIVDVGPLVAGGDPVPVARAIDRACREAGFFYLRGHGINADLSERVAREARIFFGRDDEAKAEIAMARGGRAWRGWFPVGGELTSGLPDAKEGIYFGAELGADDPRVLAGRPLHGPNLFPADQPGLRDAVLGYLEAMTELGQVVCRGLALALGLDERWFADGLTADPLVLFRVFRYTAAADAGWGVGEHTDYGLLTLLAQDDVGGLEVGTPGGWIDVPPVADAFVCNLGDMVERLTGGIYRSTPHRVRPPVGRDRMSMAFFFDPGWDAEMVSVPGLGPPSAAAARRWDGADLAGVSGTYGDYLLTKVAKVFPALGAEVLGS